MDSPLVSIIMNCYNGEKFLSEALDSVISQTYANWQLIFWDNQSVDNSKSIVFSYNDDRIEYYLSNENTSLGEARNLAMERARGKYVAFLDVDDVWKPDKLAIQICILEKDELIGIVYSNYVSFWVTGSAVVNNKLEEGYETFRDLLTNYRIAMSSAIIRRFLVSRYSINFNKRFSLLEDYDFFLKLAYYSKVYYSPKKLLQYRVHSESLTNKNFNKWSEEFFLFYDELRNFLSDNVKDFKSELKWLKVRAVNSRAIHLIKEKKRWRAFFYLSKNIRLSYILIFPILGVFVGYKCYINLLNFIHRNNYRFSEC